MSKGETEMGIYIIAVLVLGLGIGIDQFSKYLAVTHLKDTPISIIDGVFELHYLENRGAAFGMLQNQKWFFVITGILFLIAAVLIFIRLPQEKRFLPLKICILFIASGAIGNMIDRILLDYVIDFLYFKWIDFPIFNIADIYVSVSTFVLAALLLFYYKDNEVDIFFEVFSFKKKSKQE